MENKVRFLNHYKDHNFSHVHTIEIDGAYFAFSTSNISDIENIFIAANDFEIKQYLKDNYIKSNEKNFKARY